jgi:hypothetical protein
MASHCEICGEKFTWYWTHRHSCVLCNKEVCDKCSELFGCLSERVNKLNFHKEEMCKNCYPNNQRILRNEGLDNVVDVYERSFKCGERIGNNGDLSGKDEDFLWDQQHSANELIREACRKGYELGKLKGTRDYEKSEERWKETKKRLGIDF